MQFTRREFLKAGAAGVVTVVATGAGAQANSTFTIGECLELPTTNTFPIGIASGDVTNERAIVTTCHVGQRPFKMALWEADANLNASPLICVDANPTDGGFVHIDASRLKSYTNYRYAFVELDLTRRLAGRSRVGHFKTAPDDDALVPLTIGAVCCTHNSHEPVVLEHAGARSDIDLFLFLGDASYNDGCKTLKEFRSKWAQNLSKKGYLDVRASTSVIATLDDHEVTDNFDPETTPKAVLNSAVRAFYDNTPIRSNGSSRIWRSFRWGRTCEIFVLDCRRERKPSTRHMPKPQYISREQMDWLKNGLDKSKAMFKVIMNSVPIGVFPFPSESDRWEGYPEQRNEILSFIDDNDIPGVLWLSGDFHFASVGRVSPHGPGSCQTEILAGPGAQLPNYLAMGLNASKQFDWASARNNYVTLTFSPFTYEVKLCFMGGDEDPRKTILSDVNEIHRQILRLGECKPRLLELMRE
jgi:phosphodiesterase/alkaline phosphatase D-like protein